MTQAGPGVTSEASGCPSAAWRRAGRGDCTESQLSAQRAALCRAAATDCGPSCGLRCARGRLRRSGLLPGSTTDCCFEQPASSLGVLLSHLIRGSCLASSEGLSRGHTGPGPGACTGGPCLGLGHGGTAAQASCLGGREDSRKEVLQAWPASRLHPTCEEMYIRKEENFIALGA